MSDALKMSQAAVLDELKANTLRNRIRQLFSSHSARVEQALLQKRSASPLDVRRMEFKAADEIIQCVDTWKEGGQKDSTTEGPGEGAWHEAETLRGCPAGWYWAEFPGTWVWYSPQRNQARSIDHGDTLWHDLVSKRYWGPFTPPVPEQNA